MLVSEPLANNIVYLVEEAYSKHNNNRSPFLFHC